MSEKAVGYSLLVVGILVILISALSVILVFTGNQKPVQIFNFESIGLDASSFLGGDLPPEQRAIVEQAGSKKVDLIDAAILNDTSNLFAHLFLMGFVSTVGFKLASLGTMLVRPVVVKLKEATPPKSNA